MDKLTSSIGFFAEDEFMVSVLDGFHEDTLVKKAADERIVDFVRNLTPKDGKTYLHINAMGAGEYYGSNKNGDYFPEENLIEHYKTFETSPGYVYRHHINKDPARSIGKVIFAIYNERMHRVELIAEVDKQLGKDVEDAIASGQFPATSMACKTPFDICSICGNKANSRATYCSPLSNTLNKLLPDGRKVMAINSGPLRFFDISIVIRPADITSSVLSKVASESSLDEAEAVEFRDLDGGVKQASIKLAALRKLSELQKMIEDGVVTGTGLESLAGQISDLPPSVAVSLKGVPLEDSLNGFADAGISPSIVFLAELLATKLMPEATDISPVEAVKTAMQRPLPKEIIDAFDDLKEVRASEATRKVLAPHMFGCSLFPQFVEKRATEVGYTPVNYYLEDTPPGVINPATNMGRIRNPGMMTNAAVNGLPEGNLLRALLTIGGLAVLSKLYINSLIDRKLEKFQTKNNYPQSNGVKIVLEKSASSVLTSRLGTVGLALDFQRFGPGDFLKKADSSDTLAMVMSAVPGPAPLKGAIKVLKSVKRLGQNTGNDNEVTN